MAFSIGDNQKKWIYQLCTGITLLLFCISYLFLYPGSILAICIFSPIIIGLVAMIIYIIYQCVGNKDIDSPCECC